jgi:hypothetical protein
MEIERVIKDSKNVSSPLLTPMPAPKETRCEAGVECQVASIRPCCQAGQAAAMRWVRVRVRVVG